MLKLNPYAFQFPTNALPGKARKLFNISAGDQLVILGDESQGLAIMRSEEFLALAEAASKLIGSE